MLTVGLVELGGRELDYVPTSGDSWKLVQLVAKGKEGRLAERVFSDPKLDAVALLGSSPEKVRLAERALMRKKHVLVDFPAAQTVERALKLEAIAATREVSIYSPNLLKTEPGFQELKRITENSTSKMLSLTVTYGVNARLIDPEFSLKLAQLLDAIEWVGGSKIKDIYGEKSAKRSPAAALVALASFDNGLRAMLNMYSAPTSKRTRLWVDIVFKESFVHMDPYAQSIRITPFQEKTTTDLNWATSSLITVIEDFITHINGTRQLLDLGNLERVLNLAHSVTGS